MSYKVTIYKHHLMIEFIGSTSLDENEMARREIIETLFKEKMGKVLVDMTKADLSNVSLDDLIEFGKSWEGLLFDTLTKFATLVPYTNPFRDKVDLSLWVGSTKGVRLKIFEEQSLALKWLGID